MIINNFKLFINAPEYSEKASKESKLAIFLANATLIYYIMFTDVQIGWHMFWIPVVWSFIISIFISFPIYIIELFIVAIKSEYYDGNYPPQTKKLFRSYI